MERRTVCGSEDIIVLRWQCYTNCYRFNVFLIKIPIAFFAEMLKYILKFVWNYKGSQIIKTIFKKNEVGGLILTSFKMYHKSAIETVWYWQNYRYINDQWNRIGSPEINVYICVHLILTREPRLINE